MEKKGFVTGKLRLKRKTAAAKVETPEKKVTPQEGADDMNPELTEVEAKFLAVRNRFKKRAIEKTASVSFQEQAEKFNEKLKQYPLHNDLEGE